MVDASQVERVVRYEVASIGDLRDVVCRCVAEGTPFELRVSEQGVLRNLSLVEQLRVMQLAAGTAAEVTA